jgi:D-tyrosyl-tRNA(Tyr) deacylase
MKIVVQRVTEASVEVDGQATGEIGAGVVVLVGIEHRDTIDDVKWIATKIWNMRLWPDAAGKAWAESAKVQKLGVLLVSQFTLHAKFKGGNKPDFHAAMPPGNVRKSLTLLGH